MASYKDIVARRTKGAMFVMVMLMVLTGTTISIATEPEQKEFTSAEEAVRAMSAALISNDADALAAIFGPGVEQLESGDPAADLVAKNNFLKHFEEKHILKSEGAKGMVLYLGEDDWPFSIPLEQTEEGWRFNTEEGIVELLARRIGGNELNAIQVCMAYADAQREYVSKDRDGDGLREYAQNLASQKGTKNGLYWATGEGEAHSPLGPLVAEARESGYLTNKRGLEKGDGESRPYHGYYYKILTAQGENAQGGAYDYMVGDKMIGGFALAAYPAQYEFSGIMTLVTNHDGVVYQKDLGKDTSTVARGMTLFNPDDTWQVVNITETTVE
ncbi:MAG: DUF2950 domain-containing protein [Desulforhopalus sp.]